MAIYKSKFTGAQIDSILSSVSNKQDKLTAGSGIDITNNVISVSINLDLYEIVSELPTDNISYNKIYLLVSKLTGDSNKYTEYIYVKDEWEILGEFQTNVDLTAYATKSELNTANANITNLRTDVNKHTTLINNLTSTSSSHTDSIKSLENKVAPITDVAGYEVVLFKRS